MLLLAVVSGLIMSFISLAIPVAMYQEISITAAIDHPEDLRAGTARKTWESWLIESGWSINKILASQGHTMNVSVVHYYNNDVSQEEREAMKKETAGWMD
jgi:hypothetical protein